MRKLGVAASLLAATVLAVGISIFLLAKGKPLPQSKGFAGSASRRECHEKFYQLWSTSFHGLAMQPYTPDYAHTKLTAHTKEIAIGGFTYRAEINGSSGYVVEKGKAPSESTQYKIEHVLGGKNV